MTCSEKPKIKGASKKHLFLASNNKVLGQ